MNNKETRRVVIGITAHVDAGKTTLAEAMLYRTGQLRKLGRVDHGSAAMDSHLLERERGITIFLSQAELPLGDMEVTLLDTPGHVDFSAEMERTLSVLDYAILVISGVDGVQAHTRTLWRLLELYRVPTFLFVTKMDFGRRDRDCLMESLRHELGEGCVDFTPAARDRRMEQLATCREDALEAYLDTGMVPEELVRQLVRQRLVFPCWFGSGLKLEGIDEFLEGLARYVEPPAYPAAFSARVFKISHDAQGKRLTHLKVTGGTLRVRDAISYGGRQEKAAQLRIYTGGRFRPVDQVPAGGICAVQGLTATWGGQGLGEREEAVRPVLEPVMRYRMALPPDCDSRVLLPQLRQLEEEDPQLRFTARDGELHVSLMGRVQAEILRSLVAQRFGVEVELDRGRVLYKETIDAPVEGVGHYEPLRHYAEVHLLLEPLPQGSGLVLATRCPEDDLDRSWQRLIMTHLREKTHLGVLTGSPVTDMKITLMSGRAHIKHTEGGDFRQATYRAVRQGLMQARSRLLEPYYAFRLEVPPEQLGRAISDVRLRSGSFDAPEEAGDMTLLRGRVPVTEFDDYAQEVASYTGGRGRLSLEPAGYGPCHNPDAVIAAADYDPEADLENTPDSVFCAHGGGFPVKWNRVAEYMHLPGCLEKPRDEEAPARRRCIRLDDAELEAIMAREFGPVRRPLYRAPEKRETLPDTGLREIGQRYYVVDGYNVIFDWDELHALADRDLSAARERLMDTLCGWAAFTHTQVVLVFDGYKAPGSLGEKFDYRGIHVVYTKERETGDMYIERFLQQVGKNDHVRVVTSDGLIQLSAVRTGVMRMSSAEFGRQVAEASDQIQAFIARMHQSGGSTIGQRMKRT
ncbi:MAG TPA: translation elongation factor G [Oscillibacter sp.]|nr:MAG: translation elongation factor G [Oscillibacter sp.]HBL64035.1 translation elongation factor G [Oscillibacter sp.]HCV07710.1 translation elongation factor G [Oscillibacter sp.]